MRALTSAVRPRLATIELSFEAHFAHPRSLASYSPRLVNRCPDLYSMISYQFVLATMPPPCVAPRTPMYRRLSSWLPSPLFSFPPRLSSSAKDERGVAEGVGGDCRLSNERRALVSARRAGEELDDEGGAVPAIQHAFDGRPVGRVPRRREHGEVLQGVGARVGVAGVVRGRAVVVQVFI